MSDDQKPVPSFFFFPRPQVFGDWTVPLVLMATVDQPAPKPAPVRKP